MSSLPIDFLADLEIVAPKSAPPARRTRPHAEDPVSVAELEVLGETLEKIRRESQKSMEERLGGLPSDDPAKGTIGLFTAMDYGRLATAHTRTLAWLLNPKAEPNHGFGAALLSAMLRAEGKGFAEMTVTKVDSEICVGSERHGRHGRLDVMARGTWTGAPSKDWLLVIEAKIDAGEGEEQLDLYDNWIAQQKDEDRIRIFLTPDKRPPESAASGTERNWSCWTYLKVASVFHSVLPNLNKDAPGYQFLRMYLTGVLRDVCGWTLPVTAESCDSFEFEQYIGAMK